MEPSAQKIKFSRLVEKFSQPRVLFGVSLVLHVLVVLVLGHYRHPITWENGGVAEHMMAGRGFAFDFSRPGEPSSWQAPGYPYLLYWTWSLFGQNSMSYLLISLLQAVVVASIIFPAGWLSGRWFGEAAARWARWIVCVMPLFYWYPTRIHQVAIVMAFHPWLLWGWLTLRDERNGGWRAVLTGAGTGVAGLFQPVLLGVFGVLSGVLLLVSLRSRLNGQAARIFGAGLLTLLVLTPWTIRNYQVFGHLVLVKDSFGKEFWMGNNPNATGTAYIEGGADEVTNVYPPKAMELRGKVSEAELMRAMQKEAMEYVRAEPDAFVKRTLKKIFWFWTAAPTRYLRSFGEGEALKMRWLQLSYWSLFLVLSAYAVRTTTSWSWEYKGVLALYFVIYSVIYGLTHVGMARYRGEMEYILLPAVAMGCVSLVRFFQKSSGASVTEVERGTAKC